MTWIDEVQVGDSRQNLIGFLQLFLRVHGGIEEAMGLQKGEAFLFLWRCVCKAVCGLLGLASSKPGLASLEDVRYVDPSNSQSMDGIVADIPVIGRSLVMALRSGVVKLSWKTFHGEFQATVGYAEQEKADYNQFEKDVDETLRIVEDKIPLFCALGGKYDCCRVCPGHFCIQNHWLA